MLDKLQFWKKDKPDTDSNPFTAGTDPSTSPFGADSTNPFTAAPPGGAPTSAFDQQPADPFQTQGAGSAFDPSVQMQSPTSPQTLGGAEFQQSTAIGQPQQPAAQVGAQYGEELQKKDVQLILSRLDLIKSELDNVQHKLSLLEQQQKKPKW